MTDMISLVLAAVLVVPAGALPRAVMPSAQDHPSVVQALERIPLLAEVSIRLVDGSRIRGFLVARTPDTIEVKPKRGHGPAITLPLASVVSIQLKRPEAGITTGQSIVIGVVAGTAAFLGLLLVAVSAAGGR